MKTGAKRAFRKGGAASLTGERLKARSANQRRLWAIFLARNKPPMTNNCLRFSARATMAVQRARRGVSAGSLRRVPYCSHPV